MRTRVAGVWTAILGVQLVILGGIALGCETAQLLGEACSRDSECISGSECRGGRCVAPLDLGRAADAAPDVAPDATPDIVEDGPAEADAAEDVVEDVGTDVGQDVANDAAEDVTEDVVDAADDVADAEAGDA